MAERERFELSVAIHYAPFPGVCLKPLGHRSKQRWFFLCEMFKCQDKLEFLIRLGRFIFFT